MSENLTPPSVVDMIIITATNNVEFMKQVANHIQELEATIVQLQTIKNGYMKNCRRDL